MSAPRPELRALADRLGILPCYRDTGGRERETSDATRERLLRALGHEAGDETAAQRAREALAREDAERLVEPVLVYREWAHGSPTLAVNRRALRGARSFALDLRLESGEQTHGEGRLDANGAPDGVLHLELPAPVSHGHHELLLEIDAPVGTLRAAQHLIFAPRTAFQPEEALGTERAFGLLANLYSLRGSGFGHGHMGDLAALARAAGAAGADFIGTNPLHAVLNQGLSFSPYSPTSRLYRNVLYLDPEAVPELAACAEARRLLDEPSLRRRRAALQSTAWIDHEVVQQALLPLLRALHACFRAHAAANGARSQAYADYCRREGQALGDFATWRWLCQHLAPPGAPPATAWWEWPEALRDPRSPAVAEMRRRHQDEVDFECWLQFELDRQLAEAARAAREAGCRIGLYSDLALGAARASADTWMEQRAFASGASIGAPPDAYAPEGQDWGLPPPHPQRMREDGYRFFARVLRAGFAHAGALRLDHALGLVRLFWIPEGRPGSEGAYVSYRADELCGVLALESRRARALVIAEDLGTLPPELPGLLHDWGLLRSAVTRFERDADGRFRPGRVYPARALATLGTHDLPPLAGFLDGTDLLLRRQAGALADDAALAAARAERAAEIAALRARLAEGGWLVDADSASADELSRAAHAFLASTPSLLVAASLDDLAGEREPVNLPGVAQEQHPSWSRRMREPLESLLVSDALAAQIAPLQARRGTN
ncbi:MAG TPA: 4-alpha-glucanotransferase [Myxococcota bacterium]|nr:4-alpha-glucanotransferase [Myxococcota bacterium]